MSNEMKISGGGLDPQILWWNRFSEGFCYTGNPSNSRRGTEMGTPEANPRSVLELKI